MYFLHQARVYPLPLFEGIKTRVSNSLKPFERGQVLLLFPNRAREQVGSCQIGA
jgi:hypothetical protein